MPGAGCRTGTATHRTWRVPVRRMLGQNKLTNAGIERTLSDKSTSKLCVCLLIKVAQNAGCRFGNRHSHSPDPACAGSENAGSNEINKCRYY
jgi:hypothetical protein